MSRAPSFKKFGKHIETRKFDVTVRTSVCTDSKGSEWSLKVTLTGKFKNAMFSWRDFKKKENSFLFVMSTNDRGGWSNAFKIGFN